MAKVSFGKKKEGTSSAATKKKSPTRKLAKKAAPTEEAEEETEIAEAHHNPPAVRNAGSSIEGEVSEEDLVLPRINLVNALSKLHTDLDFPIGAIVLSKEAVLAEKNGTVRVHALHLRNLYQQKTEYESEDEAMVCETKQEVKDNGGTLIYSDEAIDDGRYFERLAHLVLAVKAPDDLSEEDEHHFPYEFGEEKWARVKMTVNGGSYKSFAKNIITQGMSVKFREIGLELAAFDYGMDARKNKKGSWFVPTSRFKGQAEDEDFISFLHDLAARDIPEETEEG